jgi:uncharacterized protein
LKVGNQYIIPYRGLSEGSHTFNFELGKEFFEGNSALEIPNGVLIVEVLLKKKSSFLVLDVNLRGTVELICDRCLEYFSHPLDFSDQIIVKFKDEPEEPDDKVIFLQPSDDLLDLNQYFFDYIGINIPIQKFHPKNSSNESGCNEEMLTILNKLDSKDDNNNEQEALDPRWSKLKDFLTDDNKKE